MISKELLSEILGVKVTEVLTSKTTNFLYYMCLDYHNLGENTENSINIYELAHKCKEWALNQNNIDSIVLNQYNCIWTNSIVYACDVNGRSEFSPDGYMWKYDYKASESTEPEAIFKACQWILENKDKQ